ncbi:MAG: alpha/beta fold hydrolase [Limnobacter sp.]|uniref:alpha/beta fold hydrolase n=1 Tax=Limnobacter sp. TaxID=2003368 RepID=UPI00391CBF69
MSNFLMNWISRALIDSKTRKMGLRKVRHKTQDGRWVLYKGGQGPDLFMIHGFGANKENWLALAPKLMKHHTVWIPDLIGFGESDRPEQAQYHIEEQAARVHRLATSLGVREFHVMGNSMGGFLAGVLAADYADHKDCRVLSACLLNPAGVKGAEDTELIKAFKEDGAIKLVPTSVDDFRWISNLCFNGQPPAMPGFLLKYFAGISIRNQALLRRVFREFVDPDSNPTLNDLVARTTVPEMVVWGEQDQLVHSSGLGLLKQANPAIHTLMMENTGHCPMADRSGPVAKAYRAFLTA